MVMGEIVVKLLMDNPLDDLHDDRNQRDRTEI